jgi:phosphoribosylformylglycinamidine cyclo-ligase
MSDQNNDHVSGINYKSAGVDVEAGDQLVEWLKESAPKKVPHADKLVSGIGGFAAVFRLRFPEMKKPCLVSSTDGVGTKIKLAAHFKKYDTVGQDLVAMCVNDLVCGGAEPLFFLDYYATGKLELEAAKSFLDGVRNACHASGCALIGGETAEMPGVYHGNDFDAAGFAVGIVDEDEILGAHRVSIGDQVLGVSSSGFHSNGYSLLRKVFEKDLEQWRDKLMTPTHLYAKLVLELKREGWLHAVANITGGGMENIPRVMPKGTMLPLVDWSWPAEFCEVQDRTGMSREEMLKTLNCGIGLALVVPPGKTAAEVEARVRAHGYQVYPLGTIEKGPAENTEPQVLY